MLISGEMLILLKGQREASNLYPYYAIEKLKYRYERSKVSCFQYYVIEKL